jgi:hypothetical protein
MDMGAVDIIGILQNNGGLLGGLSILLSVTAIVISWRWSKTTLINQNSWQTYQMYNSDEIRKGRAVARALGKEPAWDQVHDQRGYETFFHMNEPEGDGARDPIRTWHQDDQSIHYLLNYYHQVGMLLQRGLLDRDFTMLLVGEGLRDRWKTISRIPTFYGNESYNGMFVLYETYCAWERKHKGKLTRRSARRLAVTPSSAEREPALARR